MLMNKEKRLNNKGIIVLFPLWLGQTKELTNHVETWHAVYLMKPVSTKPVSTCRVSIKPVSYENQNKINFNK